MVLKFNEFNVIDLVEQEDRIMLMFTRIILKVLILLILIAGSSCAATQNTEETSVQNEQHVQYGEELVNAAMHGNVQRVKELLKKGADVNTRVNENTAVGLAAAMGNSEIVKILCDAGTDLSQRDASGWAPLTVASAKGHIEVMKVLLEYGSNLEERDATEATPLIIAAMNGKKESVVFLLENGADKSAKNKFGFSAKQFAENNGFAEISDLLK